MLTLDSFKFNIIPKFLLSSGFLIYNAALLARNRMLRERNVLEVCKRFQCDEAWMLYSHCLWPHHWYSGISKCLHFIAFWIMKCIGANFLCAWQFSIKFRAMYFIFLYFWSHNENSKIMDSLLFDLNYMDSTSKFFFSPPFFNFFIYIIFSFLKWAGTSTHMTIHDNLKPKWVTHDHHCSKPIEVHSQSPPPKPNR